ncbi:hypothetical protein ACH5RR_011107 [Cinchona calisaya]|uniref:WAT1-related protein n=1 Tax=Cinchona calisaya TaxID=153742 RepID=A0ABD3A6D7_9GENT
MKMELPYWVRDATPFLAMVFVECGEVAMTTLAKAAMNDGLSSYVLPVYYNSIGTLLLIPYFLFHTIIKKNNLPITFPLLRRCFLLGLLGKCLTMLSYIGNDYSSPALVAAMGNLTPIFTFLLALIFRMENIDLRRGSSVAKSLGTIIAVLGAFILTLYKGPIIFHENTPSSRLSLTDHHLLLLNLISPQSKWVLGGLLLALAYGFLAAWSVLQTQTVQNHPDKTTVVFFFMLFGSIQCALVSLTAERNMNAWILHHNIELFAVLFCAIFGAAIRYTVLTWCLNEKGPLYVALFKPLGMVIAEIGGILFLGDTLYLGSLIGAMVIGLGFYSVMWGKIKEDDCTTDKICKKETSDQQRMPLLLQNDTDKAEV